MRSRLFVLALILQISLSLFPVPTLAQSSSNQMSLQQMASLISSLQSILNSLKAKVSALTGGGAVQTAQAQTADITTGLVGHWKFDEGVGTIATDSSGNNNTGTLTNGPTWSTGKIGSALSFDGVDDYVGIAQTSNMVGGLNAFSIATWVKSNVGHPPSTDDKIAAISNSGGQANKNFELFKANINDSFGFRVYNASTNASVTGDNADPGGSWRHVVGVLDSPTITIYIDGVKQNGSATLTGPTNNAATPLYIGTKDAAIGSEDLWPGLIDEVRVYNRALTASDIATLYAYTGGPPPIPDTQAPIIPANLSASVVSSSQINLSWTASMDNVGVTGYRVERCQGAGCTIFTQIATPTGTTYGDTGLTANISYSYRVRAVDAAGNFSGYSTVVSATTQAPAVFDFSLSNGGNISITQGKSVSNSITVSLASGTSQSVSLSASGLPTGSSANFSTTSCSPSCNSTLTIQTQLTTPPGTYTIIVSGTGGGITKIAPFSLTVATQSAPPPQGAWIPPIGIPRPSFGIDEIAPALPSPWTSNVPWFYYVQTGGTNSGNGYPGNPRATIPTTLAAGSVVILAGTYDVNHGGGITANGTAANPIYIRGMSDSVRPTITQKWVVNGSYYIIEYVNATWANSSGNGKLVYGGDHGVIRHTNTSGDLGTGIGGIEGNGTDIVIWNNIVHNQGDYQKTTDDDTGGIFVGGPSQRVWVVDNICYQNGRTCVGINPGAYSDGAIGNQQIQYVYVGRNIGYLNRETNFWTKHANHVIFSQNTSYQPVDNRPGNAPISMGFQYGPENVWFLYNHIYNAYDGIVVQSNSVTNPGQNTYMIGNVIHDIANDGIRLRGGQAITVINNTISTVGNVGMRMDEAGSSNAYKLINNIIANASQGSVSTNDPSKITANNLLTFPLNYNGPCLNCTFADPKFTNPTSADFHLQSGSPAIDTGLVSSVYQTFKDLYNIDISKDFDGNTRPVGANWDIGAYEYGGVVPPPTTLIGDLNNDRIVNSLDWSLMNAAWSTNNATADLNRDGIVNSLDFSLLNSNWGRTS